MQAAITRSSGRRARRAPLAYPTRLQLYRQHPESEISIDELEQLASGRLQGAQAWCPPDARAHVLRRALCSIARCGNRARAQWQG